MRRDRARVVGAALADLVWLVGFVYDLWIVKRHLARSQELVDELGGGQVLAFKPRTLGHSQLTSPQAWQRERDDNGRPAA